MRAELALLIAALAALLPTTTLAAALPLALLVVVVLRCSRRDEALVVALGLLATVVVVAWAGQRSSIEERLEPGFESLWQELETQAATATAIFESEGVGARSISFDRLEKVAAGGATLFLIDRYGEPLAWAGPGLAHELAFEDLPQGRGYVASFASVTLYATSEPTSSPRPWSVVAARSFPTHSLPFLDPREVDVWSVVDEGRGRRKDTLEVRPPGGPAVGVVPGVSLEGERRLRGVSLVVAWALFVVAGLRRLTGGRDHVPPLVLAVFGLAVAAETSLPSLFILGTGVVFAVAGRLLWKRGGGGRPSAFWSAFLLGIVVCGLQFALRIWVALPDFGGEFVLTDPDLNAARVGWLAMTFGTLLVAARGRASKGRGLWVVVSFAAAAMATGHSWLALPLALVAAGTAGAWLSRRRAEGRPYLLASTVLLAALLAGILDEIAYRTWLWEVDRVRVVEGLSRPTPAEMVEIRDETATYLQEVDLAALVARSPDGLLTDDLAYVLWRSSPLAHRDALSALVVDRDLGSDSSFSFGLPLEGGRLSEERARWRGLAPPGWEDLLVEGEVSLAAGTAEGVRARFWLLPRPGFRFGSMEDDDELDAGLLEGEPTASARPQSLPRPFLFGLYDHEGRPLSPPWTGAPTLDPAPTGVGTGRFFSPGGSAKASWLATEEEIEILFLPEPGIGKALERLGVHALGGLLPLLALGLLVFVVSLGREDVRRRVGTSLRTYSRRLLLVNALLLVFPLAILNLVFFGVVEQRIEREQRDDGVAALASAQRVLGEYLLSLEPGFALDTTLDDSLLTWLSRVLQREVSLYWGHRDYATSKRDLFATGLLPRWLPGQVYVDLRLAGRELATQRLRLGGKSFVLLFARLDVPGVPPSEQRFVVSIPLMEREDDVVEELDSLRRTVTLATVSLLVLLGLVGTRLASDFTRPIRDLIEGTRRIAEGAPGLALQPTDLELSALAEAIDEMAGRIAVARERLMSEKHLVDRMVDSITSGVVSLDSAGNVLMANRVAFSLLGVEPGRSLSESLAAREDLAPLLGFLDGVGEDPRHATLRLVEPDNQEWTVVWVPLEGEGDPHALVVVEDVTEVLRAQRLDAWAEMARIIAHEIKNPLTPIRLSAELLAEVYASDPDRLGEVFDRCTGNILRQVEELRQIASEFSDFSQVLRLHREEADLGEVVSQVVEDYLAAPPPGISIGLHASDDDLRGVFDGKLLGRTVRNLLENAIRASSEGGEVEIRVSRAADDLEVRVADRGPGVSPDLLARIFEPYFTTHETGTGLGLAIARRIVEEHGGSIEARSRRGGGLLVSFSIPVGWQAS